MLLFEIMTIFPEQGEENNFLNFYNLPRSPIRALWMVMPMVKGCSPSYSHAFFTKLGCTYLPRFFHKVIGLDLILEPSSKYLPIDLCVNFFLLCFFYYVFDLLFVKLVNNECNVTSY